MFKRAGNLELKHVFGVRCHDIRNSVKFSGSGKPVYVVLLFISLLYYLGCGTWSCNRKN